MKFRAGGLAQIIAVAGAWAALCAKGETFRVGTYNLENYLDTPTETRHVKSPGSRLKVVESILAMKPDVLALQEMGTASALEELRAGFPLLRTGERV